VYKSGWYGGYEGIFSGMGIIGEPVDRPRSGASSALVALLLAVVLATGAYFRFTGLNWDDYVHFHPDERFLTGVLTRWAAVWLSRWSALTDTGRWMSRGALQRTLPDSGGVGGFFDAQCSVYNPHNTGRRKGYVYGTLPLFIAKIASDAVVNVTGDPVWGSYNGTHLVWRAVSAVSDMVTIAVVFLIGLRLPESGSACWRRRYACAPFAIQQSHFGTVDAMSTTFVALALLFAIRVQDSGRLLDYALFGLALAAAVASRVNLAPLVGVIVVAAAVQLLPVLDSTVAGTSDAVAWQQVAGLVLVAGGVFRSPSASSARTRFWGGFFGLARIRAGSRPRPVPASGQRRSRNASQLAVGQASARIRCGIWCCGVWSRAGLTGWLAWIWAGWRLVRKRLAATRNLVLFAWVGAYFAFMGNLWVMTVRYYLPLYPALALLAAWRWWNWCSGRASPRRLPGVKPARCCSWQAWPGSPPCGV
jgi:hypothetical protein